MKNKSVLFILAAITVSVSMSSISVEAAGNPAKSDDYYSYVQKFSDVASVNNAFHAYYLENALGSGNAETVGNNPNATDAHWCIADGTVKRINNVERDDISGSYETNKIAVLTYTKDAFLNFELSVDYKRGSNGFWPVVAIRQTEEGKYYLDDGAGVFVQQNGTITMWGDADVSGPYEFHSLDNYNDSDWHNMQIKVLGNVLYVSIDYSDYYTQALPESFYDTGYVSLLSVNNETEFRNFRIKALAEPEKESSNDFEPYTEANTSDALSKLSGEVKDIGGFNEREGKVNPDLVYTTESVQTGGCNGNVENQAVLLPLVFLCSLSAVFLRKKSKAEIKK